MRTFLALLLLVTVSLADDVYYSVAVEELEITAGELPDWSKWRHVPWNLRQRLVQPHLRIDGAGEGYLDLSGDDGFHELRRRGLANVRVHVRAPAKRALTGTLVLPASDWKRMVAIRFRLPEAAQPAAQHAESFREAQAQHLAMLLRNRAPGAAWYRHRLIASGGKPPQNLWEWGLQPRQTSLDLLSGGRALAENLQLGRQLPASGDGGATVPLASLEGITIREMDWSRYLAEGETEFDPLAHAVPADQYAVFFASFEKMLGLADEAERSGTPLLFWAEPRAEDARTRERYELQLGLRAGAATRLFGPKFVQSVALTGSDPYLRMGSDLALLLETKAPAELAKLIAARRRALIDAVEVRHVEATKKHNGLVSPDRKISSYIATGPNFVVVANSVRQLERVLAAAGGAAPALAGLDEYRFFRQRYVRGDAEESALVILSDAAIRRWCSPHSRIAASRRLRAAAELSELTAANLDAVVRGGDEERILELDRPGVELGKVVLGPTGVRSAVFNTAGFLTPIAELDFGHVTPEEARLYEEWRKGYERNWSRYFDPIAIRVGADGKRLAADMTVMPLIVGSEYRSITRLVGNAQIAAGGAGRHEGSLFHLAVATDADSEAIKSIGGFLYGYGKQVGAEPLSWLGSSVSVYVDDDPFIDEFKRAEDRSAFLSAEGHRAPVALHCEVRSPVKLTLFLTALRAFADQSAPGLSVWDVLKHGEQEYVRVRPSARALEMERSAEKWALYYAIFKGSFVLTPNEDLLKRAIDRGGIASGKPWRGQHLCFQLDEKLLESARPLLFDFLDARDEMRARSWRNLWILNEWRRLYPGRDPVELHQRLFGTRLVCPGGGRYVWNEEARTMESTTYGHPAGPREGPPMPLPFDEFRSANFGLTFEEEGLRASVELLR